MEGNESGLSSYYHHHQQQQQQHHPTHLSVTTTTTSTTTSAATNGIFSNPHHLNASSGHYSSSEGGTPLVFPPHSVTGRAPVAASAPQETVRRKRGRPRKYGTADAPVNATASSSVSSAKKVTSPSSLPLSSPPRKKEQSSGSSSSSSKKAQLVALGQAGQGFTPHVITVAAGEVATTGEAANVHRRNNSGGGGQARSSQTTVTDSPRTLLRIQSPAAADVAQKIMSFMQQRKRAVCILSASGSISNASLRQPATLGGNVTYEGRFEILSLSGSFLHSEIEGASSRTGGLSICLSGTDGRIVGGGVGGPLKAAGPVQVIAGSFVLDAKKDASAGVQIDASASKLPSPLVGATVSGIGFRSGPDPSGRITSRVNDDHQNIGVGHFMLQPRMHVMPSRSTDWRSGPDARGNANIELTGRTDHGSCQSPEDGENEHIPG